jgi:HTH-type transcriptional regulator / antitoxin HigA
MEEMGITTLNPAKYGRLCAAVVPKVIETDAEFDRLVEVMESLDRKPELTPEEAVLRELLEKLIQDYDDSHYSLPNVPPHKIIFHLMEWRHLRQADLLPIFGSRSVTSEVLAGKREPSKAHIRKLADFFHVSAELFL